MNKDEKNILKLISTAKKKIDENGGRSSSAIDYFVFSTFWFSFALYSLDVENRKKFINDIINIMASKDFSTLSIISIIFNEELKIEINSIFDKYGLTFYEFNSIEGNSDFNLITLDFLESIYDRSSEVFMHLIINIFCLLLINKNSKIFTELETHKEIFKKYNGLNDRDSLNRWSQSCNLVLNTTMIDNRRHLVGSGYVLFELMQEREDFFLENVEIEKENMEFCNVDELDFSRLNLLTGNGLSKYITNKYLKNDWLIKPVLYKEIKNNMLFTLERTYIAQKEKFTKMGADDDFLKEHYEEFQKSKIYISSNDFICDLFETIENFILRMETFYSYTSKGSIKEKIDFKSEEFEKIWNDNFKSYNRSGLNNILIFNDLFDILYNTEYLLMIFDKYFFGYEKKKGEIDKKFIFIYLMTDSILEHIWNKGEINSIFLSKCNVNFKKVFTLNYDNITKKLFGKTIHLHGDFETKFKTAYYRDGEYAPRLIEEIKIEPEIGKTLSENIEYLKYTHSTILKGGDYKMDFILNNYSELDYFTNAFDNLAESNGDFLLIGTNAIGDPHIIQFLINEKRNIYITYYSDIEIAKIAIFAEMIKLATGSKVKIILVKFQDLVDKLGI